MPESPTSRPAFRIASLREPDIAAVEALEREAGLTPWGAESWRRELQNQQAILLVAIADDQVVGFLLAWVIADEFQLNNMAVSTAQRRQGIGSALLSSALRTAREMGASRGALEVRAANEAAQSLYLRHGFVVTGRRKDYYHSPPDDALLMIRIVI
ncbi:MAG TPA: ribosomal protein S18-alanine N-acetyltransferase [Blastocatellia bacterium]|nr:ribosomal protein S18-alanine N-acetyltransferase [Blastocatellia bacterium]